MDPRWKTRILELRHRTTETEDKEYVSLVEQMIGKCTLEVAQVLMQTFTDEPDYEVQESVVSVLSSADPELYVRALLEDLPRLLTEAPQWAESLMGREVHFRPALVASTAKSMDMVTRQSLVQLLEQSSFADFYPNARLVVKDLESD